MTAPAARDDLARALLDARAENDRLRADAQAAVALVLEQAGLAVANVEIGFHDGISGEWHPLAGPSIISAACAAIRSLAPAGSLAAVDALRKERDLAVAQNDRLWAANHNLVAEQDALTAELDAAQQRSAGSHQGVPAQLSIQKGSPMKVNLVQLMRAGADALEKIDRMARAWTCPRSVAIVRLIREAKE